MNLPVYINIHKTSKNKNLLLLNKIIFIIIKIFLKKITLF